MANEGDKSNDFYAILGLNKECTESELKSAYKKLALIVVQRQGIQSSWKKLRRNFRKFKKPILGMGDFLNEMVTMMSQTKSDENGKESFKELQQLFEDMFQADIRLNGSPSLATAACSTSSAYMTYSESSNSNKCNSAEMNFGKAENSSNFNATYQNFGFGVGHVNYDYQ